MRRGARGGLLGRARDHPLRHDGHVDCVTTDTSLKSAFVFDHAHDFGGYPWFSDFTGQESTDFHLVGTPTGRLDGWATYA
jgi:hypothetical protein